MRELTPTANMATSRAASIDLDLDPTPSQNIHFPPPLNGQNWADLLLDLDSFSSSKLAASHESTIHLSTSPPDNDDVDDDFDDDFDDDEVRIMYAAAKPALSVSSLSKYQHRYLSSEEDLSPMGEDFNGLSSPHSFDVDDSGSFHSFDVDEDAGDSDQLGKTYGRIPGKTALEATAVAILFAGRPKVVHVPPSSVPSPTLPSMPSRDSLLHVNRARTRPLIVNNRIMRESGSLEPAANLDSPSSNTSPFSPSVTRPNTSDSMGYPTSISAGDHLSHGPAKIQVAPATPTSENAPRHARFRGLHKFGFLKGHKTNKTNNGKMQRASLPSTPLSPPTDSSTPMFAPSPFVRPRTAKMTARRADDLGMSLRAMSNIFARERAETSTSAEIDGDDERDPDLAEMARQPRQGSSEIL